MTNDSKEFPTLVVATAVTGIGLGNEDIKYSHVHELVEWVCGSPIWTHEIAHRETAAWYRAELLKQFPDMPSKEEAESDHVTAANKAVGVYGPTVTVTRGLFERTADPLSTLREMQSYEP